MWFRYFLKHFFKLGAKEVAKSDQDTTQLERKLSETSIPLLLSHSVSTSSLSSLSEPFTTHEFRLESHEMMEKHFLLDL